MCAACPFYRIRGMAHKSGSMPHLMDPNSMDDQQLPLLLRVPFGRDY